MLKPVVLLVLFTSLVPSFAHAAPAKCPVINGTYVMVKVKEDGTRTAKGIVQYTRIVQGVFSYVIDKEKNFQAADGVARPIRIGDLERKIRLTCEEGSLKQEIWDPSAVEETIVIHKFKMLNSKELLLESNLSELAGIYIKRGE